MLNVQTVKQLFEIQCDLSNFGLIVRYQPDEKVLLVGKPSSLLGRSFEGYDEPVVSAVYDTTFRTDAPLLEIEQTGKGRKTQYHVDMSIAYAPSPVDKVWFRQTYKDVGKMIVDVVNLFLGSENNREKIIVKDISWSEKLGI